MSLQDFVAQHVCSASKEYFVVKSDLIQAYTEWRQGQQPTMQISDIEVANATCKDVLPAESFKSSLTVHREGQRGSLKDCWTGHKLNWLTQGALPAPLEPEEEAKPALPDNGKWPELHTDNAFVDPQVHGCFHFNLNQEYDCSQIQKYLQTRVTQTFPDDTEALNDKLQEIVQKKKGIDSFSSWTMTRVYHEGAAFNVFCKK